MGDQTTVVRFECEPNWFFEAVRVWALSMGFQVVEKQEGYRLYSAPTHGISGRNWLAARHDGQTAELEAWLGKQSKNRMHLTSGFAGAVPRWYYREIFNKLLDMLEEPRI